MAFDRPFRLRVLDALTACLQTITPANGYTHDLSAAVFRGRNSFGNDDPLPMVSILEPPLPIDQVPSPADSTDSTGDWELLLQGFVNDDKKNPTDPAYFLVAEVKNVLARERRRVREREGNILGMNGAVMDIIIGPGVVRPSDEVSSKAYFWLGLTLKIAEDIANPFE